MGTLRIRSAALACAAVGILAGAPGGGRAQPAVPAPPRLVFLLVLDQLRGDRLDATLPGALGRLAREGRRFEDASHEHAPTDTCPGHAVLLSGRHPGALGIPGNAFIDRAAERVRYCVEDDAEDARTLEDGEGRSPRALRATMLGDWLQAAHPASRVFAVAGKDRAAIALGGERPDGVYWLDVAGEPRFTTSRYYRASAPAWLRRFNGDATGGTRLLERVPERWSYRPDTTHGLRDDAHAAEDAALSSTTPHPVRSRDAHGTPALLFTPYVDELTIDLARLLVHQEQLGLDEAPDLLALSLSGTDWIGHRYGPESQESFHALRHLDRTLGDFLGWLEERTGRERLLVVLTSDHGVLALPEWLAETGRSECPVAGGRAAASELAAALEQHLADRFGAPEEGQGWILAARTHLAVNRSVAKARKVAPEEVAEEARVFLASQPAIARVWTRAELLEGSGPAPFAELYRNGFDPERSGDLIVQPARDCLISRYDTGTDHGSPYGYDRSVPLVFWGAGVEAGRIRGRARPLDVAPTLARALGLAAPGGLDGRALPLRASEVGGTGGALP